MSLGASEGVTQAGRIVMWRGTQGREQTIMREWIQDSTQDVNVYLIKFTREGGHHGWQYADAAGVIDVLSDQAYAAFIDEEADDISVSVVTGLGVVPVVIVLTPMPHLGMVDVKLTSREPGKRGCADWLTLDNGAYKMMGA